MPNLTVAQIRESIDRADRDEMIGVISSSYRFLVDDGSGTALEKRELLCSAVALNPSFVASFSEFISMVQAVGTEVECLQLFTSMAMQDGVSDGIISEIIENNRIEEFYLRLLDKYRLSSSILLKIILSAEPDESLYLIILEHASVNDEIRKELLVRTKDSTSLFVKKFLQQEEVSEELFSYAREFLAYQESKGEASLYNAEEFIHDLYGRGVRRSSALQILSLDICLHDSRRMRSFLEIRELRPLDPEVKKAILTKIGRFDVLWQMVEDCSTELSSDDELALVNNPCIQDNVAALESLLSRFKSFRARNRILEIIPPTNIVANILPDDLSRGVIKLAFERSASLTIYDLIGLCRKRTDVHSKLCLSEQCIRGLLGRSIIKPGDADNLLYLLSKSIDINLLSALIKHVDTPAEVLVNIIDHRLATPELLSSFASVLCSFSDDVGAALVRRALREGEITNISNILHEIIDFVVEDERYTSILKEVVVAAKGMQGDMQTLGRELLVKIYFAVPGNSEIAKEVLGSELLSDDDVYAMIEAKLITSEIESLALIINCRENLNHRMVEKILSQVGSAFISDELLMLMAAKALEADSLVDICRAGCSAKVLGAVVSAAEDFIEDQRKLILFEVFKCTHASSDFLPEVNDHNVLHLREVYIQALANPSITVDYVGPLFNLLNVEATDSELIKHLFIRMLKDQVAIDIHTASLFFSHPNTPSEVMIELMNTVHMAISDEDRVGSIIAGQHLVKAFNNKGRDENVLLAIVRSKHVIKEMLVAFLQSDDEDFDLDVLNNILSNPNASKDVIEALLRNYILSPERRVYLNKDILERICLSSNLSIEAIDMLLSSLYSLDANIKSERIQEWQEFLNTLILKRGDLSPAMLFKIASLSLSPDNMWSVIYAALVLYELPDVSVQSILELPGTQLLIEPLSLVAEVFRAGVDLSSGKIDALFNLWVKELVNARPEIYLENKEVKYIIDNMLNSKEVSSSILFVLIGIDDLELLTRCILHTNSSSELNQAIYSKCSSGSEVVEALLMSNRTSSHTLFEMARVEDASLLERIRSHCNANEDVIRLVMEREEDLALARLREKAAREAKDVSASSLKSRVGAVELSLEEMETVAKMKASNDCAGLQALQEARRRNTRF